MTDCDAKNLFLLQRLGRIHWNILMLEKEDENLPEVYEESVPAGVGAVTTAPGTYGFAALFLLSGAMELAIWTQVHLHFPQWTLWSVCDP